MLKLNNAIQTAWAYVVVQALILGLLVFLPDSIGPAIKRLVVIGVGFEWFGFIGIVLSAVTIRSSLTPLPLPKARSQLGTTGLYKYVRHPMYSSVILLSLGIALASGSLVKYGLVISLFVLLYYKSMFEEKYLRKKYADYDNYTKKTPRFLLFFKVR